MTGARAATSVTRGTVRRVVSEQPVRGGGWALQVEAPFAGVVTLTVRPGQVVAAGEVIASIEAMKMEASITAPRAGTVARTAVEPVQQVAGGDLLIVLEP